MHSIHEDRVASPIGPTIGRLRHWLSERRAERRAVAEYRVAWRLLNRLQHHRELEASDKQSTDHFQERGRT
jgi:hypothetical protein